MLAELKVLQCEILQPVRVYSYRADALVPLFRASTLRNSDFIKQASMSNSVYLEHKWYRRTSQDLSELLILKQQLFRKLEANLTKFLSDFRDQAVVAQPIDFRKVAADK